MDILDDFPESEKIMDSDRVTELVELMKKIQSRKISFNTYWKLLGDFWEESGFPEWSEECYFRIKD
mgnify:CR=1 FL=1|tara:strand:- start:6514 stop:6711 length:198 start_codon:yes stop_codon:yes gene_type:complete